MKKYEEQLSDDALLLNQYLNQYKHCINTKRMLEHRRDDIRQEFNSPLRAVNYDGMPHGSSTGLGCAALAFRLDEIESRIEVQMNNAIKVLADIMSIIDYLPEASIERAIIEHKYIDRYSWDKICRVESITRTPATRQWRKGLYKLLDFKKVQKIIREYEKKRG